MALDPGPHVDFVLVTRTKGIFFNPHKPEGLEFIPHTENSLRFVLRPTNPERDACGHREGLECKLYASFPADEPQVEFVKSYNTHRLMLRVADDIAFPYKYEEEILIDASGKCKEGYSPRRYLCPKDIRELIEISEAQLVSATDKFLRLLRWRQGCDAPADLVEHRALYWKVAEGDYPLAPLDGGPHHKPVIPGMHGIHWDDEDPNNLQDVWSQDNIEEPLAQTLIREAAALASESPRSAILMMTTALETGVKIHISRFAPDTDWLLEEIPSPPVFKMLRDYIPLLYHRRGQELTFWTKVKPFIKKVQKLVELRNKVAHTGKIPDDAGSVSDNLELVSDVLYLLDVLAGHDWAKSLPSYEFRKALGWPNPTHGRTFLTVTQAY